MLALLLARQGIAVTLLEAHKDWAREFRGNTINPAVVQIMAELGLADQLLALPHAKIRNFTLQTSSGPLTFLWPRSFCLLQSRVGQSILLID